MADNRQWHVDIDVDPVVTATAADGRRTRASARLHTPDGTTVVGVGQADASGAGDTLAVARALSDLTRQLFRAASPDTRRPTPRRWAAELAGYVGGALMFGGATLLVASSWEALPRPARIALLATVTVALLVAGALVAGRPLPRRSPAGPAGPVRFRLAGVLLALGAGATALTAGTIARADEVFWAAGAGFVVAALGYLAVRSVFGVLATSVLSAVTVGVFTGEVLSAGAVALALALVALGLAWNALDLWGVLAPRQTGFAAGAAIALIGALQTLGEPGHSGWAYGLTFGLALIWLAGYLWRRSPVLLAAGVLGLTIAIPQAIWDWTDGAVGGAVVALIAGAVLLTASGIGLRLGRLWQPRRAPQPPDRRAAVIARVGPAGTRRRPRRR